jgi:hypothetical protein
MRPNERFSASPQHRIRVLACLYFVEILLGCSSPSRRQPDVEPVVASKSSNTGIEWLAVRQGPEDRIDVVVGLSQWSDLITLETIGPRAVIHFPDLDLAPRLMRKYQSTTSAGVITWVEPVRVGSGSRITLGTSKNAHFSAYEIEGEFVAQVTETPGEATLTLSYRNVELRDAIQQLADAANDHVKLDTQLTGKVSVRIWGMTPHRALDVVLRSQGLERHEQGDGTFTIDAANRFEQNSLKRSAEEFLASAAPPPAARPIASEPVPDAAIINPSAPKLYTVQPGDTLWKIAARILRDPERWPEIWYLNPQISNPHRLYPGDTLTLADDREGRPQVQLGASGPAASMPVEGFLLQGQHPPAGFGAYGFLLLPQKLDAKNPSQKLATRYIAACEAFQSTFSPYKDYPEYDPANMMPTYWPLQDPHRTGIVPSKCVSLVSEYDFDGVRPLLAEVAKFGAVGPLLVAWPPPGPRPGAEVLLFDLSDYVPEDFSRAFGIWAERISLDPTVWNKGFSREKAREAFRNFIQQYGDTFLQVISKESSAAAGHRD